MSAYKTPGVYVEEISVFPPSVAGVDTAIPAFIGYVSKAEKRGEPLYVPATLSTPAITKPTAIDSLPEYELYFGKGPHREITVSLDSNDEITTIESSVDYQMYDSLRMFFLNGGRKCYIVPVGFYNAAGTMQLADIQFGISALKKVDEPTLLVMPDAVSLSGTGQYSAYVSALQQCAELKDRFTICDLQNINGQTHDDVVDEFRNNIGINNLKYGACYTPWLKSNLAREIHFRDVTFERDGTATEIDLFNLTTDYDIRLLLNDLEAAIVEVDFMEGTVIGSSSLDDQFTTLLDDINTEIDAFDPGAGAAGDIAISSVRALYNRIRDLLFNIIDIRDNRLPAVIVKPGIPDLAASETYDYTLGTDIDNIFAANDIADSFEVLLHHSNGINLGGAVDIFTAGGTNLSTVATAFGLGVGDTDPVITALYPGAPTAADAVAMAQTARDAAQELLPNFMSAAQSVLLAAMEYEITFENSLPEVFSFYKNALSRVTDNLSYIPPSGAMAGVYATIDGTRGVFKAPANTSLAGVNGLTYTIDNQEQEGLNVDSNAGKSINVIRAFKGKGILVWGARTLAGNDNEWRYIPVRRFFIFAEESIQKAVAPFVFEPNDSNTWTKVKSMITNFLTVQWRSGALAGAKPAQAFFVKIGLGETMTALDILEGRMIVEIGMAVVRPAEFIILRFSHKMQEA